MSCQQRRNQAHQSVTGGQHTPNWSAPTHAQTIDRHVVPSGMSDDPTDAAIRLLRGERDLPTIMTVLEKSSLGKAVIFSPHADPLSRSLCALLAGLTPMITEDDLTPDLQDAVLRIITEKTLPPHKTSLILDSWKEVAPVGWGKDHERIIMDAVQQEHCTPETAAALIGPGDTFVALGNRAIYPDVFRIWGRATPDDPSAWVHQLPSSIVEKVISTIIESSNYLARSLPWLPVEKIRGVSLIPAFNDYPYEVVEAFRAAPFPSLVRYRDILMYYSVNLRPLETLAMLASLLNSQKLHGYVYDRISKEPNEIGELLVAYPWYEFRDHRIVPLVLDHAKRNPDIEFFYPCAIFAAAIGRTDSVSALCPNYQRRATRQERLAFFGSIRREIWEDLKPHWREWWLSMLQYDRVTTAALAIRSLGMDKEVLSRSITNMHYDFLNRLLKRVTDWETIPSIRQAFFPHMPQSIINVIRPIDPNITDQIARVKQALSDILPDNEQNGS